MTARTAKPAIRIRKNPNTKPAREASCSPASYSCSSFSSFMVAKREQKGASSKDPAPLLRHAQRAATALGLAPAGGPAVGRE